MVDMTYFTLNELARDYLGIDDSLDDTLLEIARTAGCRGVDLWCGRRFYVDGAVSARVYKPDDKCIVCVDDISTVTGLVIKTDDNDDGTFETTWATTDYQLEPLNGIFAGIEGYPYNEIHAIGRYFYASPLGRSTVQVTANWGWAAVPAPVKAVALDIAKDVYKQKDVIGNVVGWGEYGSIRIRESPLLQMRLQAYKRNTGIV